MKILEKIKAFSTGEGGTRSVTDEVSTERKHRSRRGFTIVELVIALSVIVIVTGVSIGVVSVTNKSDGETIDMIEATNIGENAVECFRFALKNPADDNVGSQDGVLTKFETSFLRSLGFGEIKNKSELQNGEKPESKSIYREEIKDDPENPDRVTSINYTVTMRDMTVTVALSDSKKDKNLDTITVSAASSTDENLIEKISYTVR